MKLCSNGHDEVCYDAKECPVCLKDDDISRLENRIENLERDKENLEYDLSKLQNP